MYLTSSEIVAAIKNNDDRALEGFYLKNYRKVEQFIVKNNGSSDDAKDIYQEAFVSVWRNIQENKFSPINESSLDGYLYRIAQNKWLDHLRSSFNKKQKVSLVEEISAQFVSEASEDELEFENKLNQIRYGFLNLGQNCKELLSSFYYDKKNLKIIAEKFGWTEATAKNNKYRCLQKLKEIVQNKKNEEGQSTYKPK